MEPRLSSGSSDSDSGEERPSFVRQSNQDHSKEMSLKRTYECTLSEDDDPGHYSQRPRLEPQGGSPNFDTGKNTYHNSKSVYKKVKNTADNTDLMKAMSAADEKAHRMMKMMGYKKGEGLGKHGQGRLEPVKAAKQQGRRGLGLHIPGLEEANLKWDPEEEVVSVKEEMQWLKNNYLAQLTSDDMADWMRLGPSKETIIDETNFCHPDIVKNIVNSKTIFDHLDKQEMRRARTRSNPYETIQRAFFLNRAAVKMANMDRACDFMFTKPKKVGKYDLLYFADVCAGPGGFSEYVLWRKKWRSKGFGFTLKNETDFKLDDFHAGSCETFHPFYGPKGDGNVYDPENQEAFRQLIMEQTKKEGVHFMMSDGGFSVEGKENIQEILSKQLYLCQCLVALMTVRVGGHFVTKLFDLFTPFSAGLVYLMYRCFDDICIFKPNTSRPANSERYLICRGKRQGTADVMNYLSRVNDLLLKRTNEKDVMQLVPQEVLESQDDFMNYLIESNNTLGKKQIVGLLKIAAFCQDTNLIELRQAEMREECLKYWQLPDECRKIPYYSNPDERLKSLLNASSLNKLQQSATVLTEKNMSDILTPPCDWYCMPCLSGKNIDEQNMATFYMGMGRSKVFRYWKGSWTRLDSKFKLELPPDTLVYAEMVMEMRGEFRNQRKTPAIHILDAYFLGAEDVSRHYLPDRYELTKKFCEALWKPNGNEYVRIRAKVLHSLDRGLEDKLYSRIKECTMKNSRKALVYVPTRCATDYDNDKNESEPYYFVPNSILFLKGTAEPWSRQLSHTKGHHYFFNIKNCAKMFDNEKPPEVQASFSETFIKRVVWNWPHDRSIPMDSLLNFVKGKCPPVALKQR